MLSVYVCRECGLVQLKNPAKLKQYMNAEKSEKLSCPKCGGLVEKADISYAEYAQLSEDERKGVLVRSVGTKILVTGANGQLGISVNKMITQQNADGAAFQVINTSRSAGSISGTPVQMLDITSEHDVKALIQQIRPQIIINCAAYTAVDQCESEEELAYAMNALGPKYLAEAAKEVDAVFIHISTDYVFSGEKQGAYLEEDTTAPQSAYGRTKLAGEELVKQIGGKYFIVRTAWLYGEGKNFVRTMLRLAEERKQLSVVCDQRGTPTSSDELARVLLFLSGRTEYGIYHATCEGETTWYDFAKKIFELAGKVVEVEPVTSEEYKSAAVRPKNSVLENGKLHELGFQMQEWEDALREYYENTIVQQGRKEERR